MSIKACTKCGAMTAFWSIKNGSCLGCRNPHLVVSAVVDTCDLKGCDRSPLIETPWGKIYCSPKCEATDYARLVLESEHERIAEITSGGQV